MADAKTRFMQIPPRHQRTLEMLAVIAKQPHRDIHGAVGIAALRDEDEPFTLEQIVDPLMERGLIENLSETELGTGGRYFVRITRFGEMCLGLGYMLRESRKPTQVEIKTLSDGLPRENAATALGETIVGTA
jgi:hypothetical protein